MSYSGMLTESFILLERTSTDTGSGRPSREWKIRMSGISGRLEAMSAEERNDTGQYYHAVTHRLWIENNIKVDPEDLFIPDIESNDPQSAYDVKGIIDRESPLNGVNKTKYALVEETQIDNSEDYL